jgi:hypothetical protein
VKRALVSAFALASVAVLLAGCERPTFGDSSADGPEPLSDNAVYNDMAAWDACLILNDLEPVIDYMGIEGWGSSTGGNPLPTAQRFGNTWDPGATGCGGLIYLGSFEGFGVTGELLVKIVPAENEDQAATAYADRVAYAETEAAKWTEVTSEEFSDPWDQGTMMAWTGNAENSVVHIIAQDGQWVFNIRLYHSQDWGAGAIGGEPILSFTPEERNRWLVDTYLPEANQLINDAIAAGQ